MPDHLVTCINKSDRMNPWERITHIGGNAGKPWRITQEQAIRQLRAGEYKLHTLINGRRAQIIVAKHEGHEYLKTENDGYEPNNLLALAECPV